MKYVKLFEAWTEELVDEVPHQDLYETLEELLDAWKAWKENEDEDKDEEELHDEFMEKLSGIMDKVKGLVVVEEEEEEEEPSEEKKKEPKEDEEEEEEEEPKEEEPKEDEDLEEAVEFPKRPDDDLSKREGSLTYYLEPLLVASATMSFDELMAKFMEILDNPDAKIGPETRARWRAVAGNMRSKIQLMNLIKDVYLAGSGMRTTPKKRRG